jgi:hypothetical protein
MYAYFLYEIDKLNTADLNRRAEIHRMVTDARRERRANRQLRYDRSSTFPRLRRSCR